MEGATTNSWGCCFFFLPNGNRMLSFECRVGGSFSLSVSFDEEVEGRGFGEETRGGGDFVLEADVVGDDGLDFGETGGDDAGRVACGGVGSGKLACRVGEKELFKSSAGPESKFKKASSNVGLEGSGLVGTSFETGPTKAGL